MRSAGDLTITPIYDRAWRVGRIEPLGEPVPLDRLLDAVRATGARLRIEPTGGPETHPYPDGLVVAVEIGDESAYCAVPSEAIPMLGPYLDHDS